MEKRNNTSAITLVNFLLYSMWGLFLFYVFEFIMYLYNSVGFYLIHGKTPGMILPVVFRSTDKGTLHMPNSNFEWIFSIPEGTGVIHAFTLPPKVMYLKVLVSILTFVCTFLTIFLIIKMLKNARDGGFLVAQNAIRLRSIGLLMIVMFVIDKAYLITSSMYFRGKLEFPGLDFTPMNWYSIQNWSYLFLYLFLIIIAEAFRLGAQLKEENDLTI